MQTYRSLAARMGNARRSTQSKLDRRLEILGEQIGETLGQLTDLERMALTCWKDSIMPNTYEIDHQAITDRPYVSIRYIEHVTEEYDVAERNAQNKQLRQRKAPTIEEKNELKQRINNMMNKLGRDPY